MTLDTDCCIVGGGPAGIMLGYLLARSGVKVSVLEKHSDFFRDFRGDTIHPSTMEVLSELGLQDKFLSLPHQQLSKFKFNLNGHFYEIADLTKLDTRWNFVAFIPQWDFLNFLSDEAKRFETFSLHMNAHAQRLLYSGDAVSGVAAETPEGELIINSRLVVACDGRHSEMREAAKLPIEEIGVPIDVLWMRLTKKSSPGEAALGYSQKGRFLVLIDRDTYFQAGFLIRKGTFAQIQQKGLEAFKNSLVEMAPFLREGIDDLNSWDAVKLLTVRIDRLTRWHAKWLLCIGDAAHAMSPAGGVGINLAIQDAVAAANILVPAFRRGEVVESDLDAVQSRREKATKQVQGMQSFIHRYVLNVSPTLLTRLLPFALTLINALPFLRSRLSRMLAFGPQPEHVKT